MLGLTTVPGGSSLVLNKAFGFRPIKVQLNSRQGMSLLNGGTSAVPSPPHPLAQLIPVLLAGTLSLRPESWAFRTPWRWILLTLLALKPLELSQILYC